MKRYVIAEIGSNFDQKKSKVFKMINEAKKCGADAVKFQLFKASLMYPNDKKMYYYLIFSYDCKNHLQSYFQKIN